MEKLIELGWDTQAKIQDHSCCSVQEPLAASLPGISLLGWMIPDVSDGETKGEGPCPSYSPLCSTLNQVSGTGQGLDGMCCWVNSWLLVLYCIQCEGENNNKKVRKEGKNLPDTFRSWTTHNGGASVIKLTESGEAPFRPKNWKAWVFLHIKKAHYTCLREKNSANKAYFPNAAGVVSPKAHLPGIWSLS